MKFRTSKISPLFVYAECKTKNTLEDKVILECGFCNKETSCMYGESIKCTSCDDVKLSFVGEYVSAKKFKNALAASDFVDDYYSNQN